MDTGYIVLGVTTVLYLIVGKRLWDKNQRLETQIAELASYIEQSRPANVIDLQLRDFLAEQTQPGSRVSRVALYARYVKWTKDNNEFAYPRGDFAFALARRGIVNFRDHVGGYYEGFELVEEEPESA